MKWLTFNNITLQITWDFVRIYTRNVILAGNVLLTGNVLLAGIILLSACSSASTAAAPLIAGAWARPAAAGQNSAIYFTIDNSNGPADHLVGIAGEVAESLELHRSQMDDNGVMSMEHQPMVEVPAGGKVVFTPGDYHVMLMNLKQDLKLNDTFEVMLKFQNAGEITTTVKVAEQ